MKAAASNVFTILVSLVVILAIGVGIFLIDSPQHARLEKLDAIRVTNLRAIERTITRYQTKQGHLPQSLAQLMLQERSLKDPVTGQAYEYAVTTADAYDLCAVFDTSQTDDEQSPIYVEGDCSTRWKHEKGRVCFSFSKQKSC